jgi:hypothetical protein
VFPVAPPSGAATGYCFGSEFSKKGRGLGRHRSLHSRELGQRSRAKRLLVELSPNGTPAIRRGRLADGAKAAEKVAARSGVFEDLLEPRDPALVGVGVVRGEQVVVARVAVYRGFIQDDMRLLILVANDDGHGVQKRAMLGISGNTLPERKAVFLLPCAKSDCDST